MKLRGIERVKRARSQLVMDHAPFYGIMLLDLTLEATTQFPTFATDGKHLWVNEEYADTLTDGVLRGVLVHEVKHVALGHHVRRGERDPVEWNEACDLAINGGIIDEGYELLDDVLLDRQFAGLSAEEIYHRRRQEKENKKSGSGGSGGSGQGQSQPGQGKPNGCGEVIDAAADPVAMAEAVGSWKAKVFMAASVAKAKAGKLPAGVDIMLDDYRKPPKENWRDRLRSFVDQSLSKDYSWARPNKRYIGDGLYLPALVSDAASNMLVGIDTSGSIDRKALAEFSAEQQDILDSGCTDKLTAAYCDTKLHGEVTFERGDEVKLTPKGGGGTSFAPVMKWARDQEAACLIYFTDLECDEFGDDPGMPVLWATWNSRPKAVPFGEVIYIDPYDR
jgi:predicted metal-dependent peptidase